MSRLIYALVGAALALLVSGRTLDWAFGEVPISMSVLGVVILLRCYVFLICLWLHNHRFSRDRE